MPATNRTMPERQPSRSLLSTTSIIILSGFLIGTTLVRGMKPQIEPVTMYAGCVGLVAWIGLRFATRRHRDHVRRRAVQQATLRLERRIDRHIAHQPPICRYCRRRVRQGVETQYLTVVNSRHWGR